MADVTLVFPIVEVHWVDSAGYARWDDLKEHRDLKISQCRTVGYLITDQPDRIVVSGNLDDALGNADHSMAIPRCAITRIDVLRG